MSMRPLVYPLSSFDPIRTAFGGGDESLVDRMVAAHAKLYQTDDPEAVEFACAIARAFVVRELKDGKEPDGMGDAILLAACALGMTEGLPINEDWKWMAWSDYEDAVAVHLPDDVRRLLHWLVEGRTLQGEPETSGGSYYAWLEPGEVEQLHSALKTVEGNYPEIRDAVEEFHDELMEWLGACQGKALFLLA